MIAQVDGLEMGLIQRARLAMNKQLDLYEHEASRANTWLKDLDSTIEDLRMAALTRRCRISVSEVEMLALHVNRISFRLRNFKSKRFCLFSFVFTLDNAAVISTPHSHK